MIRTMTSFGALVAVLMISAAGLAQKTVKPPSKAAPKPVLTGAEKTEASDDEDINATRFQEAQAIIDDIKNQSPPDRLKFKLKMGVMQTYTNAQNAVSLGGGGETYGFAFEGMANLFDNFGVELRETYSQNVFADPKSINKSNTYMSWLDFGPRYTFYLDSAHLDNNVVIKLMYHENYNNLQLAPEASDERFLWVNYYSGFAGSFERNIPVTNKLGLMGMFDLIQITNTSCPNVNTRTGGTHDTVAKSGYAFQIQAEIYYKLMLLGHPSRVGIEYWQQGNQSEVDDTIKQSSGHNSYFQVTRALFGTMSMLF